MISVADGEVELEKSDGVIMSVPLDKLSKKDQAFIKSSGLGSAGGGGFEELDRLRERRDSLMKEVGRHQRLAKMNPNLMVGDIIRYEKFPSGIQFGLITTLGFHSQTEVVNESGEIEIDRSFTSMSEWSFYDRVSKPLEMRTWSSSNGTFKIKARLTAVDGDDLTLDKQDGGTLNVPATKLSKTDQSYVKRVRKKLGAGNDDELERSREDYSSELLTLLERREEILKRELANIAAATDASKMKSIRLVSKKIDLTPQQLKPMESGERSLR